MFKLAVGHVTLWFRGEVSLGTNGSITFDADIGINNNPIYYQQLKQILIAIKKVTHNVLLHREE